MFDSLLADLVFGWRQLAKRKVTSLAAILSLGLAIGACTAAFRIADALFFRPLLIAHPERLYELSQRPGFPYAQIRPMRAGIQDDAELIAISRAPSVDIAYGAAAEIEKASIQFVSGRMFGAFGLKPALGRLLTESDDLQPGAHPVAVISFDYWTRRFARNPNVIGRAVRLDPDWRTGESVKEFSIVGVSSEGFTGTDTGAVADLFLPAMMHAMVEVPYAAVFQAFVMLRPGASIGAVAGHLTAILRQADPSRPHAGLLAAPAASGASALQKDYRQALMALGILAALVLLIACVNVANLMTAQASSRSRELALRISIGATRARLVQLVLVESALLAIFCAAVGAVFAVWSGSFVVRHINPPDNPARLMLAMDWRVALFSLALLVAVTGLFGLPAAGRASRIQPAGALKAGRVSLHAPIAGQVAFCFVVLSAAGLLLTSFERLSNQSTGISVARLLNLNIVTLRPVEPAVAWDQVAEHLRHLPGVESVAYADWPVLDGYSYKTTDISINGVPPNGVTAWNMNISPGWISAMGMPLVAGRDLRPTDPAGTVIVNEEFAKDFFNGQNPVGKTFQFTWQAFAGERLTVAGVVRNARYRYLRRDMLPVAYTNFREGKGRLLTGTIVVRTAVADPLVLASALRQEVSRANPDFRVSSVQSQQSLIDEQTVRERLLAMLAGFFAAVALLLAGVGLYGVLDYSVYQRRREIGIRMAIGARASHIIRGVTGGIASCVLIGAAIGLALGIASTRYLESLLFQVKAGDAAALAIPAIALLAAVILAALPPVLRAIRTDPARVLRAE